MALFDNIDLSGLAPAIKQGIEKSKQPDEFQNLPEGNFLCQVTGFKVGMTALDPKRPEKIQKPMATFELTVVEEGDYLNRKAWLNMLLQGEDPDAAKAKEKTINAWARFMRALKIFFGDYEFEDIATELTEELVDDYILDQFCVLTVKNGKNGGQFLSIGPTLEE